MPKTCRNLEKKCHFFLVISSSLKFSIFLCPRVSRTSSSWSGQPTFTEYRSKFGKFFKKLASLKKVEKPCGDFASWLALTPPTFVRDICFSTQRSTFLNFWLEISNFFSVAMPQDSEKEKAVERRSLVGMPPTMKKSQSGATPARPQRETI